MKHLFAISTMLVFLLPGLVAASLPEPTAPVADPSALLDGTFRVESDMAKDENGDCTGSYAIQSGQVPATHTFTVNGRVVDCELVVDSVTFGLNEEYVDQLGTKTHTYVRTHRTHGTHSEDTWYAGDNVVQAYTTWEEDRHTAWVNGAHSRTCTAAGTWTTTSCGGYIWTDNGASATVYDYHGLRDNLWPNRPHTIGVETGGWYNGAYIVRCSKSGDLPSSTWSCSGYMEY